MIQTIHPDLAQYVCDEDSLSVGALADIDEHVYECAQCRELLLFIRKINSKLIDDGRAARNLPSREQLRIASTGGLDVRATYTAVLRMKGNLSLHGCEPLAQEVIEALRRGTTNVVVDLTGVGLENNWPAALSILRDLVSNKSGSLYVVGIDRNSISAEERQAVDGLALYDRLEEVPLNRTIQSMHLLSPAKR
jgi:predicted anti-sigma-YlaC factor YlaD